MMMLMTMMMMMMMTGMVVLMVMMMMMMTVVVVVMVMMMMVMMVMMMMMGIMVMVMVMVLTHKLTLKVSRNYVDLGWLGGLVAGWLGGWLAEWSTSDYSCYLKANQLICYIQLSLGGQEPTFKVAHLHTKIRLLVQNFQGHMNLYLENIFGLNLTPTPNLTANMIIFNWSIWNIYGIRFKVLHCV